MIKFSELTKNWYSTGEVGVMIGRTSRTILNYIESGILIAEREGDGWRSISKNSLIEFLKSKGLFLDDSDKHKKDILYARVSSNEQKDNGDLDRQIAYIIEKSKDYNLSNIDIIKEVGSGLNDSRSGLNKILKMVVNKEVNRVFVLYKERLTRFGFNYILNFLKEFDVELIVINSSEEKTPQEELVEDMMSLIASFSGKFYGLRSSERKKAQKKLGVLLQEVSEQV